MKIRKTIPNVESFKYFLQLRKKIALTKNKVEQHNSKWSFLF